MNTSAYGVERGTLIRVPATANLMLDSQDRNPILDASGIDISSPWSFTLTRRQALINGFFSRIGTSEVILEWGLPNIVYNNTQTGDYAFRWQDVSGTVRTVPLISGNYTVKECLDQLVSLMNAQVPIYAFTVSNVLNTTFINAQRPWRILPCDLAKRLSLNQLDVATQPLQSFPVLTPDLRPTRYIDFVCEQLTSVQDVKDASTKENVKDVLCRWYFADDAPPQLDAYGFPILPGYTLFSQRRIYNPPKQIKWEQNKSIGGFLQFSVYDSDGNLLPFEPLVVGDNSKTPTTYPISNWLMTLQLSEG
jgi:hypothetical protein